MPIIKSAKKRARQEIVRRERNATVKRRLREAIRSFDEAVETGKKAAIDKALKNVQSELDTAVKKNLIHRNKAARKLSQLNKRAKEAGGTKSAKSGSTAKKSTKKAASTKKTTKKTSAKKTKK